MPSRFGHKKNTPQGVSYKNVIQLYSRLISVNPRNHESSSNFPLSESRSHSITVLPLPVSALIRSPARSFSELIRLQVRADTAAHARSYHLTLSGRHGLLMQACPLGLSPQSNNHSFTFPVIPRRWEIIGSPPLYGQTLAIEQYLVSDFCNIFTDSHPFQRFVSIYDSVHEFYNCIINADSQPLRSQHVRISCYCI